MRAVIDDAYRNHKRLARITISDEHNTTVVSILTEKVYIIPMVKGYILELFHNHGNKLFARILASNYEDCRRLK